MKVHAIAEHGYHKFDMENSRMLTCIYNYNISLVRLMFKALLEMWNYQLSVLIQSLLKYDTN